MRWIFSPQRGQGLPNFPCAAISGRNAVTFSGKSFFASAAEPIHPQFERFARCRVQAMPLLVGHFLRLKNGRELRGVENFVGVGVADAAEVARIGESALDGVIFGGERGAESGEIGGEDVDAAGVESGEIFFAADDMERRAMFCAGFGEDERAVGEIKCGEHIFAGELCIGRAPVEAAGDHQVKNEPEVAVEADGDAFADAAQVADGAAFGVGERRDRRCGEETACRGGRGRDACRRCAAAARRGRR